jgi:hypothetical protein
MDTVIAPNVQHVTGAAIITVLHKTDSRDRCQATPSSDDENVQKVRKTPARAAVKSNYLHREAPAANKPPEKSAQILMPMATKEGFRTLFATMNEQNTKTTL